MSVKKTFYSASLRFANLFKPDQNTTPPEPTTTTTTAPPVSRQLTRKGSERKLGKVEKPIGSRLSMPTLPNETTTPPSPSPIPRSPPLSTSAPATPPPVPKTTPTEEQKEVDALTKERDLIIYRLRHEDGMTPEEIQKQLGTEVPPDTPRWMRDASKDSGESADPQSANSSKHGTTKQDLKLCLLQEPAAQKEEDDPPSLPSVSHFMQKERFSILSDNDNARPLAFTLNLTNRDSTTDLDHKDELDRIEAVGKNQTLLALDKLCITSSSKSSAVPTMEEQIAAVMLLCDPNVCSLGWKCFFTELSCTGKQQQPDIISPRGSEVISPRGGTLSSPGGSRFRSFIERKSERTANIKHQFCINPRSPVDQRMWIVACKCFERVKRGKEKVSTTVLKPKAEMWARKNEFLQRDQTIPLGIFIIAAIYMNIIDLTEIAHIKEANTPDIYLYISSPDTAFSVI